MRGTVVPLLFVCLAAFSVAGGCGLSEEVGDSEVIFELPIDPTQPFTIGTSDPRWWPSPSFPGATHNAVPEGVCSGGVAMGPDCCEQLASMRGDSCDTYPLTCGEDRTCALVFDYESVLEIDIGKNVDVLQDRRGWVLSQASLDEIRAGVEGIESLPVQALGLYAGPQAATSSRSPGVRFLSDVRPVTGTDLIKPSPEAQAALTPFLLDFNTPFSLILSAHVVVKSGPMPNGVATIGLSGRVNARF
jgi:hypothetical protein